MAYQRSFSFDNDDERPMGFHEQERLDPNFYNNRSPYRDLPSRPSTISPPPHYSSPAPHEPVSPITPTRSRASNHSGGWSLTDRHRTFDETARPILDPASDVPDDPIPPPPPAHRQLPRKPVNDGRIWGAELGYSQPSQHSHSISQATAVEDFAQPGVSGTLDNMGYQDHQRRESYQTQMTPRPGYSSGSDTLYSAPIPDSLKHSRTASYNSQQQLAAAAAIPGALTPGTTPRLNPSNQSSQSIPLEEYPWSPSTYSDSPYHHTSQSAHIGAIDPYNIADDGDDGFIDVPKRKSVMAIARQSSRDLLPTAAAGGAAAGAGIMRRMSGIMGKRNTGLESQNTNYDPVNLDNASHVPSSPSKGEKSEWLSRQTKGNNKMKWILFGLIGGVILIAIIGGVIGGVAASKHHKSAKNTDNASSDTSTNGDLDKNSAEIQALMGNDNLHKVFPAIDYTPWGTQYPLCMTYPPSQNNVTRDMAVLSQLTNTVRLYGTDCNQTEMVLHAIDKLELTEMRVWMGVWIDFSNETTNDRQLSQMYRLLENSTERSIYKGVIVGNEALYRAGTVDTTAETSLIDLLTEVKSNFTSKGYDISVGTSDLGDNWNAKLVTAADFVMSNIHPFFAGVTASEAASWTWEFWQNNDVVLTEGTTKPSIISETGWPSAGGNDCGTTASCTSNTTGSVAGVTEMNTFMEEWICQALGNGTEYFWFEAFDEPWKVIYNTDGKDWEDKWGLMDSARNLKEGLKIPDCDGKTID